jgi:hypothetical protein
VDISPVKRSNNSKGFSSTTPDTGGDDLYWRLFCFERLSPLLTSLFAPLFVPIFNPLVFPLLERVAAELLEPEPAPVPAPASVRASPGEP